MPSGVRDFSVSLVSRFVGVVAGIGTQSSLAWLLKAEGRGSYAVVFIFMSLLSLIFLVGCDSAGRYFVASKKLSLSGGIIHTIILGCIGSTLAIIAGLIILKFPLSFVGKANPRAFYMGLALIPINLFATTFSLMLTAVFAFNWFAVVFIVRSVSQLLCTLLFIGFFSLGVEGAVLGMLVPAIITVLLSFMIFRCKYNLQWERPTLKSLYEMVNYGLRYYLGKISNMVNMRIGTIILAFFATKTEIGLFAVATTFTTRIMVIPDTMVSVLHPRTAKDKHGHPALVAFCVRMMVVVCGVVLLMVAVFAKPIVAVLFSSDFYAAVPLVRIIAIGVFARCACKIFVPYLIGTNRPGVASMGVAIGAAVNLLLLYYLFPILGLSGAAIAMSCSFIVSSIILAITFNYFSRFGFKNTWLYKRSDFRSINNIKRIILARVDRTFDVT